MVGSNHENLSHEIFSTMRYVIYTYKTVMQTAEHGLKWLYCGTCSVQTVYQTTEAHFHPQYHVKQSLVRPSLSPEVPTSAFMEFRCSCEMK